MFARFFTLLRNDDFEATEDRIFTSDIKFVLEPWRFKEEFTR